MLLIRILTVYPGGGIVGLAPEHHNKMSQMNFLMSQYIQKLGVHYSVVF